MEAKSTPPIRPAAPFARGVAACVLENMIWLVADEVWFAHKAAPLQRTQLYVEAIRNALECELPECQTTLENVEDDPDLIYISFKDAACYVRVNTVNDVFPDYPTENIDFTMEIAFPSPGEPSDRVPCFCIRRGGAIH